MRPPRLRFEGRQPPEHKARKLQGDREVRAFHRLVACGILSGPCPIKPAPLGHPREHKPRWARLIHHRHRTIELLQESWHHAPRLTAQALQTQLAGHGIEHSGDRPRPVNVEPNKRHTL